MDPIIDVAVQHAERPSWRKYGEGQAEIRLSRHTSAKWVSIRLEESYSNEAGKLIGKQTSMTLRGAEVLRILDAIAPGLVKSSLIAAEILRGLQIDAADAEVLKNLDAALQQLDSKEAPIL